MIIRDQDYRPLFYITWALAVILLVLHINASVHINQLKSDNAELHQAVASMIDSQNQLIDKIDDETKALKKLESKLGDWDGDQKK